MNAPCAWCAKPSTTEVEAMPADINTRTMEVRKRAIIVPVCDAHRALVERESSRRELEKKLKRLEARSRHWNLSVPKRAEVLKEVEQCKAKLAELREAA